MGLLKFDFRTVADAAEAASFFFWAAASAVACFFASAADFASAAFAAASTFLASAAFAASCFFAAAASLACLAACGGDRIGLAHDGASEGDSADAAPRLGLLERGVLRRLLRGGRLWGNQRVSYGMPWKLHGIEQVREAPEFRSPHRSHLLRGGVLRGGGGFGCLGLLGRPAWKLTIESGYPENYR